MGVRFVKQKQRVIGLSKAKQTQHNQELLLAFGQLPEVQGLIYAPNTNHDADLVKQIGDHQALHRLGKIPDDFRHAKARFNRIEAVKK